MEVGDYIILNDQQLITLSMAGDNSAFGHLVGRYRESMRKIYLQRTSGNSDDVDDLIQDTFLKVWLNLSRYNPTFTFGQWLYTIARNTFIDYIRRRPDSVPLEENTPRSASSTMPTPEELIINAQQRARLDEVLAAMRPQYKRLIELRFFRDYSYEEIAAELGIPLGTVKTQLHRAREKMIKIGNFKE